MTTTPREEDLQAVNDSIHWLRKLFLDGLHKGFIDSIGQDTVGDVLLRLERTRERMREDQ